ncbi:MAG: glucose-1-phosphate adenylyltransferase, partial [Clostridiales bacterium]|nr:glucose-1-phosphate adenylyltransferase [Clostridiales bacterium]
PALDLDDANCKIYSRNDPLPPTFFGENARVDNCIMTTGCEIYGKAVNSVIGEGVVIGEGAVVENSVIMSHAKIGKNVTVRYGMIDENVTVGDNAVIGDDNSNPEKIALIGRGNTVAAGTKIAAGEIVD